MAAVRLPFFCSSQGNPTTDRFFGVPFGVLPASKRKRPERTVPSPAEEHRRQIIIAPLTSRHGLSRAELPSMDSQIQT
jgi:hypothetical protein